LRFGYARLPEKKLIQSTKLESTDM
jgi:hypothetical protein